MLFKDKFCGLLLFSYSWIFHSTSYTMNRIFLWQKYTFVWSADFNWNNNVVCNAYIYFWWFLLAILSLESSDYPSRLLPCQITLDGSRFGHCWAFWGCNASLFLCRFFESSLLNPKVAYIVFSDLCTLKLRAECTQKIFPASWACGKILLRHAQQPPASFNFGLAYNIFRTWKVSRNNRK